MKGLREAMGVMTSMKEVYDIILNDQDVSKLPDAEQAQLTSLKETILKAIEAGDAAWSEMTGGNMTAEDSSAILSFVRTKNDILGDL